jgi:hypothetical protein
MAIGDVFLLRTQFRSHARVWTVNQHYLDDTGQDDATASADLTDAWQATNAALAVDALAADSTLESLYSVKLTGGDAMPSLDVQTSTVGDQTGNSVPPNTCVVVSLGSTDPALIRPGRLYVGGIPKSGILAGNLSAAYLAVFLAKWAAIAGDQLVGVGGTWTPCIFLTVLAGVPRVPPIGVAVTSVRVKPILYSQRRRNSRQQGVT